MTGKIKNSETLTHILSLWSQDTKYAITDSPHVTTLPFNIEQFCLENDEKLNQLRDRAEPYVDPNQCELRL